MLTKMTPEGFWDLLFPESYKKRNLETKIRDIFGKFCYLEHETPILEFYDLFGDGRIKSEAMYKFFDKQGRILALRPDITIPIARIVASKFSNEKLPLRFSYIDKVFRFNENYGRQKEISQAGIELIGVNNSRADAEVIIVIIESLIESGLTQFQIDIGQVDFFKGLLEDCVLKEDEVETLSEYVDKKDVLGIKEVINKAEIAENLSQVIIKLPSLYGGINVISDAKELVKSKRSLDALENIEEVAGIITQRGYQKYISIDLGMVKRLNYYTGLIFRGFSYGVGYPILSGGRYDDLIQKFGVDLPAVGGYINITELMIALDRQKIEIKVPKSNVMLASDRFGINNLFLMSKLFRNKGYPVEEDLSGLNVNQSIEYANSKDYRYLLYFEDECIISIYNLKEQKEKKVSVEKFQKDLEDDKWII